MCLPSFSLSTPLLFFLCFMPTFLVSPYSFDLSVYPTNMAALASVHSRLVNCFHVFSSVYSLVCCIFCVQMCCCADCVLCVSRQLVAELFVPLYFLQTGNEMGGACSTMGERRGMYRVLVGKPNGKRPLGRHQRRWENNINS